MYLHGLVKFDYLHGLDYLLSSCYTASVINLSKVFMSLPPTSFL